MSGASIAKATRHRTLPVSSRARRARADLVELDWIVAAPLLGLTPLGDDG